jgi:signal transduction histidine kinase
MARQALRELWYLIDGAARAVIGYALFCLTIVSLALTFVGGLGVPALIGVVALTRRLADSQRRWDGEVLGGPIVAPYQALPSGLLARYRAIITDKATWRDFAWLGVNLPISFGSMAVGVGLWAAAVQCVFAPLLRAVLPARVRFDPLVLPVTNQPRALLMLLVSPAVIVVAYQLPRHLITGRARLARWLLAPTAADLLSRRVGQLAATRAVAVDSAAAELRRIERDLHDGPQARLVSLAMNLGMAEDVMDADPATAKTMMIEARGNARATLEELRSLVRGIHPPVLADRGLVGAVQALALSCPIPIDLDLRLDRRLPAPVESAGYFVVAEALANAIRHSGAGRIHVVLDEGDSTLKITVMDNGRGGADPTAGTGLLGIQHRLAALDGVMTVASPPLGPTMLHVELPCGPS